MTKSMLNPRTVATLSILTVLLIGGWSWYERSRWLPLIVLSFSQDTTSAKDDSSPPNTGHPDLVQLPAEKTQAADLVVTPLQACELQPTRWVPALVTYDETRHIEVKAPAAGMIRALLVKPGQQVAVGDPLLMLESSELGEALASWKRAAADARLAEREYEQHRAIHEHLLKLLYHLQQNPPMMQLEQEFADKPLGNYREPLFTAYSKLRAAETLLDRLLQAGEGVVAGRTVLEQQATCEQARAEYLTARETAHFSAELQLLKLETQMEYARRLRDIALERVISLTGLQKDELASYEQPHEALSLWPIRAPIAGTIEDFRLTVGERVQGGDSLFVLANTDQLWIRAELRERDWQLLPYLTTGPYEVDCPGLPGQIWQGKVVYIGRTQQGETRAIPVVLQVDNQQQRLRPGMFARAALPSSEPLHGSCLPAEAVQSDSGRPFIFVQEGPGTFRRVPVKLSWKDDRQVMLEQGPALGTLVVTRGAFLLKSELLLEPEE
ncbi:MAG: hemolysin D [Planctomycetaceae bacterium]|nr:MAG: hemolysin D [Planctomycetaceae bacterium]